MAGSAHGCAGRLVISWTDIGRLSTEERSVESILIRNLPEGTKAQLAARAERHRRSMEAEARDIIADALARGSATIVDFLAHQVSAEVELETEPLGATARAADL